MSRSNPSMIDLSRSDDENVSRARPGRGRAIRESSKPSTTVKDTGGDSRFSAGWQPIKSMWATPDKGNQSSTQNTSSTRTDMQSTKRGKPNKSHARKRLEAAERNPPARLQAQGGNSTTRDETRLTKGQQNFRGQPSSQVLVQPNRDFRAKPEHLETLFDASRRKFDPDSSLVKAPDGSNTVRDVSGSTTSKDFRATPDDVQRHFDQSSNNHRNQMHGMSNVGQSPGKHKTDFLPDLIPIKSGKINESWGRSTRHDLHNLDNLSATEPPRKVPRKSQHLRGSGSAQFGSSRSNPIFDEDERLVEMLLGVGQASVSDVMSFHGIEGSILPDPGRQASSRVGGRGTQDDPFILDLDEADDFVEYGVGQDVEMEYGTSVARDAKTLTRDCAVCGDPIPIADLPCLVDCTHRAETCALCFAQWIESELRTKGWKAIICPGVQCKVLLSHHEIQQYATADVFAQYDAFATRDAVNHIANFRWCQNPGCNSGQETDEEGYIFTCIACGHKTCTIHNVDWHENETCDEYTYRTSGAKERDQRAQEEASIAAINSMSKKCPGFGCDFSIQKNEGCDHMTCTRCRHEFCWECLADYKLIRSRGNMAHEQNCKYHSDRLR